MSYPSATESLLVGLLAARLGFVSENDVAAALEIWARDKSRPLTTLLAEQGKLSHQRLSLLDSLLQEVLKAHHYDPKESLAGLPSTIQFVERLRAVPDPDLQAGLNAVVIVDVVGSLEVQTSASPSVPAKARYRVLRSHAKGGLGEVFLAEDTGLHRQVALKEIQLRHANDPDSHSRFVLEAEVTGRLEHPGIVPMYDLGWHEDGRPFYAMRFIQGRSLAEAITRFHKEGGISQLTARWLEFRQLLGRFVDMCHVVVFAHSRGVLHCDLKPAKVLLGDFGETLVMDWGLARFLKQDSSEELVTATVTWTGDASGLTSPGTVEGTPAYMSPEQAAGQTIGLTSASDVYSLGATLYCLLTGQAPFKSEQARDLLRRVQQGDFPSPRQVEPAIPQALAAICSKAMALQPADRYSSAKALAEDVEHWLADEPVSACREPLLARVGRWVRRHRTLVAGSAASFLIAVLTVAASVVWFQHDQAEREKASLVQEAEQAQKRIRVEEKVRGALQLGSKTHEGLADELQKRGGVFRLLNKAEDWQVRLKTATTAVAGARELAAGAGVDLDPDLGRQLDALDKALKNDEQDRRLVLALALVRQKKDQPLRENQLAFFATASKEYERLFREAGLAVGLGKEEAVAAAIRQSPIREQLVAALDDWTWTVGTQTDQRLLKPLLGTAGLADPDLWCQGLRNPSLWKDRQALKKHVAKAPKDQLSPAMLSLVGKLLRVQPLEAESWLRSALVLYPNDFLLNLELGMVLVQQEKHPEALGFLRVAAALQPASLAAQQNLAWTLTQAGQFDDALAAVQRALAIDPDDAIALTNHCQLLQRRGDLVGAERAVLRAMKIAPTYTVVHLALGDLRVAQKDIKEAAAVFEKAVRLNNQEPRAHLALGIFWQNQRQPEKALISFREAYKLNPEDPLTCGFLGKTLAQLQMDDEAIVILQKSIRLSPRKDGSAYAMLGGSLMAKGRYVEARDAARQALEFVPANSPSNQQFRQGVLKLIAHCDHRLAEAAQAPSKAVDEKTAAAGIPGELSKDDPLDNFPLTQKSHRRLHLVQLAADKVYQIDLTGKFDTFLRLEDPAGKPLLHNDDASPPKELNSRLIFAPPVAGPYRLIVTSYEGGATGPYVLRVQEAVPSGKPIVHNEELTIKDRKSKEQFIKDKKVELIEGRSYTIEVESDKFGPFLVLFDPTGKQGLAQSPDRGTIPGKRVRIDFTPPATATYTLMITSRGPGETGAFTLRLQGYEKKAE